MKNTEKTTILYAGKENVRELIRQALIQYAKAQLICRKE